MQGGRLCPVALRTPLIDIELLHGVEHSGVRRFAQGGQVFLPWGMESFQRLIPAVRPRQNAVQA